MTIKLRKRDKDKNIDFYKKQGLVPGVSYGSNVENTLICANFNEISRAFETSEGQFVEFEIDDKKIEGILKDRHMEPISGKISHFDIYIPSLDKPVLTSIPLIFLGVEKIEKSGLIVNKNLTEIEIEALPRNIPENIEVDISSLTEARQSLFVKDLKIPRDVKITIPEETAIVSILELTEKEEQKQEPEPKQENQEQKSEEEQQKQEQG